MNMPRLGTDAGKEAPFLLASLAEQIRIADKLDALLSRVDAGRERLERVPKLVKRFRQSVLSAAVSGELTREWRGGGDAEWEETTLGAIAEVIGGVTKDSKNQSNQDEEFPYLRVANVQRGYLDLSEIKTIRISISKAERLLLEPGDILFNEGGDADKLGRGWIWEGQIERCSFQNHVFRARLMNRKNSPKYVSWWGNTEGLNFFLQNAKQTTNLASINKSMLIQLPIMLPTPPEQAEIVRRVEALFALADRLEVRAQAALARYLRLTPSLLAKAFRGELVPQDPTDEPASVLLSRIRAQREAAGPAKKAPGRGRKPNAATHRAKEGAGAGEGQPTPTAKPGRGRPRKAQEGAGQPGRGVPVAASAEEVIRLLEARARAEREGKQAVQAGLFGD